MFPDLENADRLENPDAGKRWSGAKIALMTGGMVGAALISLVLAIRHDSALEPWDDLAPAAATVPKAVPGPAENGYLFLRKKWSNSLYSANPSIQNADGVVRGTWLWDEEFAAEALAGMEDLPGDVSLALKMPHWQPDRPVTDAEWQALIATVLHLSSMTAVRAGDLERALDLLTDAQELSARMLTAKGFDLSLDSGTEARQMTAACCCDLLASGKVNDAALSRLSLMWEGEPLNRDQVSARFLKIISQGRRDILEDSGEVDYYSSRGPLPKIRRLFYKPNRTANHYQDTTRVMLRNLEALPENLDGAIADAGWEFSSTSNHDELLGLFQPGLDVERARLITLINFRNMTVPMELFINRAMRVRLALYRWQQDHAGALPGKLTELVPDYLPALPADPWSGAPLLWDPGKGGVIFAVGGDWTPDTPYFSAGTWFSRSAASPGLRLAPPPPKPRPVKAIPAPKTKKAPLAPKRAPAVSPVPASPATPPPASSPPAPAHAADGAAGASLAK